MTTQPIKKFFTATLPDGVFWITAVSSKHIVRVLGIQENFIKPGANLISTRPIAESIWLLKKNERLIRIFRRRGKSGYGISFFKEYSEMIGA